MVDKLIEVYRAEGETEALIVKGRLESSGVPCLLQSDGAPSVHMMPFTRLGVTKVVVPERFAAEAKRLIAEPPPEAAPEPSQDESC